MPKKGERKLMSLEGRIGVLDLFYFLFFELKKKSIRHL